MKTIEVKVKGEMFKIIRNDADDLTFSIFNYATFHTIKRNDLGIWTDIEHRFGSDNIPLDEIGEAIDNYYNPLAIGGCC